MDDSRYEGVLIFCFILNTLFVAMLAANGAIYYQYMNTQGLNPIQQSSAYNLYVTNVVLSVLFFIPWIVELSYLIKAGSTRRVVAVRTPPIHHHPAQQPILQLFGEGEPEEFWEEEYQEPRSAVFHRPQLPREGGAAVRHAATAAHQPSRQPFAAQPAVQPQPSRQPQPAVQQPRTAATAPALQPSAPQGLPRPSEADIASRNKLFSEDVYQCTAPLGGPNTPGVYKWPCVAPNSFSNLKQRERQVYPRQ